MFDLSLKECFFKVRQVSGDRKILLTHVFRLPTFEDWVSYNEGTMQVGLSKGRDTVEVSDVLQERDAALWEDLIIRTEGYVVSGKPLMDLEDWKERIPLPHKLQAVSGFFIFDRSDVPEDASLISEETFDLEDSSTSLRFAVIQNFKKMDIVFYMKTPGTKDHLRFSRITSKMQLVRTKKRGESAIKVPTNLRPFVELFDKLVEKVEGFIFEKKDLMEQKDWQAKLDAFHKRGVVQELFTAQSLEEEFEGKPIGE